MNWIQALQMIICLAMYRLIEPEQVDQDVGTSNSRPGHVPLLDTCLGQNTVTANYTSAGVGRMRGHAFGCGNLAVNKRAHVGAEFEKIYALSAQDLLSDEAYQFRIQIAANGRMRHFPAVSPGGFWIIGEKQPPPITLGMVFTIIRVRQGGATIGQSNQYFHYYREHSPDAGFILDELTGSGGADTVTVNFTPSGNSVIFFEVATAVQAAAWGDFSDIQVGGINSLTNAFMTVQMASPVVQKRPGDDICGSLLGVQRETLATPQHFRPSSFG